MAATQQPDTRNRLLQAAASLMWERSFQATGVDELCERANARKGSFYHFFPSKTDLAVAAIEQSWQQVKEGIFEPLFSTDESGLEQIKHLVETVYDFQQQMASEKGAIQGCPFGSLGQEMANQNEPIRRALKTIFDAHCRYIETALDRAVEEGAIPPGDNHKRAANLFALLQGVQLLAKVTNDPALLKDVMDSAMAVAAS